MSYLRVVVTHVLFSMLYVIYIINICYIYYRYHIYIYYVYIIYNFITICIIFYLAKEMDKFSRGARPTLTVLKLNPGALALVVSWQALINVFYLTSFHKFIIYFKISQLSRPKQYFFNVVLINIYIHRSWQWISKRTL